MFYKVSIAGTDTGKILERMKEVAQLVGKQMELDCHLADGGVVTVHTDRTVTGLHPPLKFGSDGRPEERRILVREVLDSIG